MTLTQAGLCEGYGGISMAVTDVLGAELAWYSEHEPATEKNPKPTQAAARLLAHHHPGIPNHGDLTVADWSQVQPVDVLTGGWPCQPWSTAGKQKGVADERAIWPHVARAVRDLRPAVVVLENVAAIVALGELARAVGDLAGLGYVGAWRCVRASDVGAPHRRRRVFIVAAHPDLVGPQDRYTGQPGGAAAVGGHPDPDPVGLRRRPSRGHDGVRAARLVAGLSAAADPDAFGRAGTGAARDRRDGPAHGGVAAADAARVGRGEGRAEPEGLVGGPDAAQRGPRPTADPDGGPVREQPVTHPGGCAAPVARQPGDVDWGVYGPAIHRWAGVLGRSAPAPTVLGARGGRQLSPAFVEWLMGLPEGHVDAVPGLTRNEKLKILGNGVVPQQCAHAIRLALPSVLATAGQERAA